jgi:hypothetical protein
MFPSRGRRPGRKCQRSSGLIRLASLSYQIQIAIELRLRALGFKERKDRTPASTQMDLSAIAAAFSGHVVDRRVKIKNQLGPLQATGAFR